MIIGVPKEIKKEEYRVGVTPSGVDELKRDGHRIFIETGAGEGSGFSDNDYIAAGADITSVGRLFEMSELIVKVKEPLTSEFPLFREGQAIFTYLHLAANRELTEFLLKKSITAIGYETIEKNGGLPLLAPMSEIAGRMAPLMGAYYLQAVHGGRGILSSGAVGTRPVKALIIGAGTVGANTVRICAGLGMDTVVINKGVEKLQRLDDLYRGRIRTLQLNTMTLMEEIRDADIIIGAVLVPGGRTPVLITREMLKMMRKGTVLIDVAVDQGGCFETSRPTTHDKPVYTIDGIIHYAVANMPGAYPRTSTLALTNATLGYIKTLAAKGIDKAVGTDPWISSGLNTYGGWIAHKTLAASMNMEYKNVREITN